MSNEARGESKGWGVVRQSPFHLAAVFPEKNLAEAKAEELGPEYAVQYGANPAGSNDFVQSPAPAGET